MAFTGGDGKAFTICLMQNMSRASAQMEALIGKRWHHNGEVKGKGAA